MLESSHRQVLEEMEMLSTFTTVLHVPNLSTVEHLVAVLEETNVFNKAQIETVKRKIGSRRLFIGIKKLLGMIDMAKHFDEERRVIDFLSTLESEGFLEG